MTQRRAIPNACGQLLDEAVMAITTAIRLLKPVYNGQSMTNSELTHRIGQAIINLQESNTALQQIKLISLANKEKENE